MTDIGSSKVRMEHHVVTITLQSARRNQCDMVVRMLWIATGGAASASINAGKATKDDAYRQDLTAKDMV